MKVIIIYMLILLYVVRPAILQKELGDIDLGCPQGTYRFRELCYSVSSIFATFEDAEVLCETGGGILAVVKDAETQHFLQKLRIRKFLHRYWIGISDRKVEGEFVYMDNTRLQGFSKWHRGEPNNFGKNQHCVSMWYERYLEWDDEDCSRKMLYICEYDVAGNCTFNIYGHLCYEISQTMETFDDAQLYCKSKGGNLASVMTEGIFSHLKTIIYAERWWFNMTEKDTVAIYREQNSRVSWIVDTWIGIRYNNNGEWICSDGTTVDYNSWAAGEPNNLRSNEDCVKLGQNWFDVQCDLRNGFICQYNGATVSKVDNRQSSAINDAFMAETNTISEVENDINDQEDSSGDNIRQDAMLSSEIESSEVHLGIGQFSAIVICSVFIGMVMMGITLATLNLRRYVNPDARRLQEEHDIPILYSQSESSLVDEYAYKNTAMTQ